MWRLNKVPFVLEPIVDLYEIEIQVKEAFEEHFGQGMVLDISASTYPERIGVLLFLKNYDRSKAYALGRQLQAQFAGQGVRLGILVLPSSVMKVKYTPVAA